MDKKELRAKTGRLPAAWIPVLAVLPLFACFVCLCIGRNTVTPGEVIDLLWKGLTGRVGQATAASVTVLGVRLPRVILALLVGAGLSAAGLSIQSLFANPLATPDTVGVANGASFGAALGLLCGFSLPWVQVTSFFMGLLAVGLTWSLGRGKRKHEDRNTVVLSGIMIGSLFSALVSLVKFWADSETKLPAITYFLMGSLSSASYKQLLLGAGPVVLGVIALMAIRFRLNLLPFSEDEVRSFGVNVRALRAAVLLLATMITAACVSMCGMVGWIGLLVPHMCRMMFKNDHQALLPASLCFGAVFMVIVDTLARSVSASEIPVSVFTALLGAPFFIFLMRKTGGWSL